MQQNSKNLLSDTTLTNHSHTNSHNAPVLLAPAPSQVPAPAPVSLVPSEVPVYVPSPQTGVVPSGISIRTPNRVPPSPRLQQTQSPIRIAPFIATGLMPSGLSNFMHVPEPPAPQSPAPQSPAPQSPATQSPAPQPPVPLFSRRTKRGTKRSLSEWLLARAKLEDVKSQVDYHIKALSKKGSGGGRSGKRRRRNTPQRALGQMKDDINRRSQGVPKTTDDTGNRSMGGVAVTSVGYQSQSGVSESTDSNYNRSVEGVPVTRVGYQSQGVHVPKSTDNRSLAVPETRVGFQSQSVVSKSTDNNCNRSLAGVSERVGYQSQGGVHVSESRDNNYNLSLAGVTETGAPKMEGDKENNL